MVGAASVFLDVPAHLTRINANAACPAYSCGRLWRRSSRRPLPNDLGRSLMPLRFGSPSPSHARGLSDMSLVFKYLFLQRRGTVS